MLNLNFFNLPFLTFCRILSFSYYTVSVPTLLSDFFYEAVFFLDFYFLLSSSFSFMSSKLFVAAVLYFHSWIIFIRSTPKSDESEHNFLVDTANAMNV